MEADISIYSKLKAMSRLGPNDEFKQNNPDNSGLFYILSV